MLVIIMISGCPCCIEAFILFESLESWLIQHNNDAETDCYRACFHFSGSCQYQRIHRLCQAFVSSLCTLSKSSTLKWIATSLHAGSSMTALQLNVLGMFVLVWCHHHFHLLGLFLTRFVFFMCADPEESCTTYSCWFFSPRHRLHYSNQCSL